MPDLVQRYCSQIIIIIVIIIIIIIYKTNILKTVSDSMVLMRSEAV